jgi:hypothetical protein
MNYFKSNLLRFQNCGDQEMFRSFWSSSVDPTTILNNFYSAIYNYYGIKSGKNAITEHFQFFQKKTFLNLIFILDLLKIQLKGLL